MQIDTVVYELTEKPSLIGVDQKTGKLLRPEQWKSIKLIDDVVIKREGDDRAKSYAICVVAGEPSIFLEDHSDKRRNKSSIESIAVKYGFLNISEKTKNYPQLLEFLSISNKSNVNGSNKPSLRKKDFREEAKQSYATDQMITKTKAYIYDNDNIEYVKGYAFTSGILTPEQCELYGDDVLKSRVSSSVNGNNAKSVYNEISSELSLRKYQMIGARDEGRIKIDFVGKRILYGENNSVLCSTEGMDAIEAAAKHTMTAKGEQAYLYIMGSVNASDTKDMETSVSKESLDAESLQAVVSKGLRLDLFKKTKRGYMFEGVMVGGDNVKIIEHFTKNPEKIDKLKAQILYNKD